MHLPVGTLIKKRNDKIIYRVSSVVTPSSGIILHKIVNAATDQLVTPNLTIFEMTVIDNRELYKEVIEYKIAFKKKVVAKLNKELKEYKVIKDNLDTFSSDEEELNAFIEIFKSEKSKAISKLLPTKEHINFNRFALEWVR